MDSILKVEGLSKNYGDFQLKDVSFEMPYGSIMGFVGENGAGKTTTIKLLLNLIRRNSGRVKIFGLDNIKDEKQIKEQIGVVFDESYFHDYLKAKDISRIMKNVFREWNEIIFNEYLGRFQLPKDKYFKEYSRGMKMKMSIATALSHNPRFLILDEATSGLDPVVRSEILDVFLDFIQKDDHAVFISSHVTSDLEKIADYITFIHRGELIFSQSKDVLLYDFGLIKCGLSDAERLDRHDIIGSRQGQFGLEALIKNKAEMKRKYPGFVIDPISIEEIMLFYIRGEKA